MNSFDLGTECFDHQSYSFSGGATLQFAPLVHELGDCQQKYTPEILGPSSRWTSGAHAVYFFSEKQFSPESQRFNERDILHGGPANYLY